MRKRQQATNNDGVDTAKSNGLDSINNIQPTVVERRSKTQRLTKRRKLSEIDQQNATDEEQKGESERCEIDKRNNETRIDTAKSNGLDSQLTIPTNGC